MGHSIGNVDSGAISPDADRLVRYCTIGTDLPPKDPHQMHNPSRDKNPSNAPLCTTARATQKLSYESDRIFVLEEPGRASRHQSLGELTEL